jgi:hypothetical protein
MSSGAGYGGFDYDEVAEVEEERPGDGGQENEEGGQEGDEEEEEEEIFEEAEGEVSNSDEDEDWRQGTDNEQRDTIDEEVAGGEDGGNGAQGSGLTAEAIAGTERRGRGADDEELGTREAMRTRTSKEESSPPQSLPGADQFVRAAAAAHRLQLRRGGGGARGTKCSHTADINP